MTPGEWTTDMAASRHHPPAFYLERARQAAREKRFREAATDFLRARKSARGRWPSPAEEAAVLGESGRAWHSAGCPAKALPLLSRAAQSPGLPPVERARLHSRRGVVLYELGRYREAEAGFRRSLTLLAGAGEPRCTGEVHLNLSMLYARTGKVRPLLRHAREAMTIFGPLGDEPRLALACHHLGIARRLSGDLDGAEQAFARSLRIFSAHSVWGQAGRAAQSLGNLALIRGRPALARNFYEQSRDLKARAGERGTDAFYRFHLGLVAFEREEYRSVADASEGRDPEVEHRLTDATAVP